MREQLIFMAERVNALRNQASSNFPDSLFRVQDVYHEELITYKIKLEELLEETDIKEQSIKNDFLILFKSIFLF